MAKKQKDQKMESFRKVAKPIAPPRRVHNDSEGKKQKRGDFRKLKYKEKLH